MPGCCLMFLRKVYSERWCVFKIPKIRFMQHFIYTQLLSLVCWSNKEKMNRKIPEIRTLQLRWKISQTSNMYIFLKTVFSHFSTLMGLISVNFWVWELNLGLLNSLFNGLYEFSKKKINFDLLHLKVVFLRFCHIFLVRQSVTDVWNSNLSFLEPE